MTGTPDDDGYMEFFINISTIIRFVHSPEASFGLVLSKSVFYRWLYCPNGAILAADAARSAAPDAARQRGIDGFRTMPCRREMYMEARRLPGITRIETARRARERNEWFEAVLARCLQPCDGLCQIPARERHRSAPDGGTASQSFDVTVSRLGGPVRSARQGHTGSNEPGRRRATGSAWNCGKRGVSGERLSMLDAGFSSR